MFKKLFSSSDKPPEPGVEPQLPQEWKTVHVFISSTFRDMHSERDYLIKVVFPELRERCMKRGLYLVDLDLRWGITEEEAEQKKIVNIILNEIDRSRPFFIAILGERYGSVIDMMPEDAKFFYPWLAEYKGHSITALEIIHGVLRNPKLARRSFFYFRNPQFLSKVPESKRSDFTAESSDAASKLKSLKEEIYASGRPVMDNYPCRWDNTKGKIVDLDSFGGKVLEDLWQAICKEYPEEALKADPVAIERKMHNTFSEERSHFHIGRIKQKEELTRYVKSTDRSPVVITGKSGCGKSAFLASWSREYSSSNPSDFVLSYFIGASPNSTNYFLLLRNICEEIKHSFSLKEEIPKDDKKLSETLTMLLIKASRSKTRIILVIDALDQLSPLEAAHSLGWLLDYMPEKVRLVLSSLEGDCLEVLRRQAEEITLPPLTKDEQKQIILAVLSDWHRKLDNNQMELLLSHTEVSNPLYLRVALEELRLFGVFEKLTEKINKLPEDILEIFGQVLSRLEEDHGRELVKEVFSLIGSSRYGLSEPELLELLRRKDEEQLPRALWVRLLLSTKSYLVHHGNLLGFFHRQLAEAVASRYLKKDNKHEKLASYFSHAHVERKLDEYPYQLHQARDWKALSGALSDLEFFSYALEHNRKYEWMGYWNALQENFEPGSCYQASIEAREKKEGKTLALALLQYDIGLFLFDMGLYYSSLPFMKKALMIYEEKLGKDHPDATISLVHLADIYRAQGKYSEAEPLYRRSLKIREKSLGLDHPDVAQSLNNLALLYHAQGRYSEAEPLYRRALQIYKEALGEGSLDVAVILNNLANLYYEEGKYGEAEPLYRRVSQIYYRRVDINHPNMARLLNDLAEFYIAQGKYSQAEAFHRRAIQIKEKKLGKDHPYVATSLNNLAALYHDQRKYNKAEPLYKRAIQIREKKLGKDHPYVAGTLNNLALLYWEQRKYNKAEPIFKRVTQIYEKKIGKDSLYLETSLTHLAYIYKLQGRYSKAELLYRRAIQICEKKIGKNYFNIGIYRKHLKACQDAKC